MANILVIGAGVAGLSAGIYARLSGHDVTVCEAHSIPGGNLTGWQRGEYHIDNCIHWLTGTNPYDPLYSMWCDLGALGGVKVHNGERLYTCELDGSSISLWRDIERMKREMLELSPEDEGEILSFIRGVELVERLNHVGGKEHNEGATFGKLIAGAPILVKYYRLSCGKLAERFESPLLRFFLSSIIGRDFGSLALLMIVATFCSDNGGIPEGGSYSMAQRMAKRLCDLGGTLLTKKRATHFNRSGERIESVKFDDGDILTADYVIVTSDPDTVFGSMTDLPMPKDLEKCYGDERLFRFSAYHCAFACDTNKLPFEGDVLFKIPIKYYSRLKTDHITLREFSHEPSYAPEGKTVLGTMTYLAEEDCLELIKLRQTDREAYNAKKRELAEITEDCIIRHYPELEGKIHLLDTWTPASYKRFTYSEMGAFMSFALPARKLPIPTTNRVKGAENLILATQWQRIPGGLPTAATFGKIAIETINKLEKKKSK